MSDLKTALQASVALEAAKAVAPAPVEALHNEATTMMAIVERMAMNGSDPDKVVKFYELAERAKADVARREFLVAMNQMQPLLPIVGKRGTIEMPPKSRDAPAQKAASFAKIEDIDEACRPIYTAHGFSVTYDIEQTDARITAFCVVGHIGGHERRVPFSSPIENTGFKNNTQGWGSALQYCKRYSFCAAFNIVTKGIDDDGKKAGDQEKPNTATVAELQDLIKDTDSKLGWFLQNYSVETLDDLTGKQREEAKGLLLAKKRKAGGKS